MRKILVIGGASARTPALADALLRSRHQNEVHVFCPVNNLGLWENAVHFAQIDILDLEAVAAHAKKIKPDFAIIGPEEPLALGVADLLAKKLGIPCVSPLQGPMQIESSKVFCRGLIEKYGILGNPEYRVFRSMEGIAMHIHGRKEFVIKPDGLAGGKGVRIFPDHFRSLSEVFWYCDLLFKRGHRAVLIEERLRGMEFSLQSFCDGRHILHTPPVQDYKPVYEGDRGPFGGGMGSYSCEDFMLPFLSQEKILCAEAINTAVMHLLAQECGEEFVGMLYGSFIITPEGRIYVIEMNGRWGDPECLNTLAILETDLIDVGEAQLNKKLYLLLLRFRNCATVCKYVVPEGYPTNGVRRLSIDMSKVPEASDSLRIYYGGVEERNGGLYLTGSRAVAFVGVAPTLSEAERIAENAASMVGGPVYHRRDIGRPEFIDLKMRMLGMSS